VSQHPQAGTDLQDALAWRYVGGAHHGAKYGGVDQEVLTEPLVGTQTVSGQQVSDPRPGSKRFSG
jgi:hypothetical protein